MSALACIFGRHRWYVNRHTGLNGEIPVGWRCSACGSTKIKR